MTKQEHTSVEAHYESSQVPVPTNLLPVYIREERRLTSVRTLRHRREEVCRRNLPDRQKNSRGNSNHIPKKLPFEGSKLDPTVRNKRLPFALDLALRDQNLESKMAPSICAHLSHPGPSALGSKMTTLHSPNVYRVAYETTLKETHRPEQRDPEATQHVHDF